MKNTEHWQNSICSC